MSNMTKKIISLSLFAVILIVSLGFGIYANVKASEQKTIYDSQTKIYEKFDERYQKSANSENPIINSIYFQNLFKDKAESAKQKADAAQAQMRKYFIFSAILIFVACAMLVCSAATFLSMKKLKSAEGEAAEKLEEVSQPEKEERAKSEFDMILEAPKTHINEEEQS